MKTTTRWQRLTREPLLHFLLLGAILFAVDHVLAARADDPRVIVVTPAVDAELQNVFRESKGRLPEASEMKVLRDRWVDNEVLYREGLSLGVDRGDSAIRDRVVFKALSVVQANIEAPSADEAVLRTWFEQHRADYEQPARIDFREAVMLGDRAPEAIAKFVAALNAGTADGSESGLRVYRGRPRGTVVTSFGAPFTDAVEKLPPGQWRALTATDGVHVVQLERTIPAMVVTFEEVRGRVHDDWKDVTMQTLRTKAVREIARKYVVRQAEDSK